MAAVYNSEWTQMRKAQGFITADGSFFESAEEAALYEAELRLRGRLTQEFPDVSQDKFFAVIITTMKEIKEYVDAHQVAGKRIDAEDEDGEEVAGSETPKTNDGLGHVASTEEDLASLLRLPERRVEGDTRVVGVHDKRRRKDMVKQTPKRT